MKAFVYEYYGPPAGLKMQEIARPVPAAGELLVRVRGIALNPADWRLLRADPFLVRLEHGLFRPKKGVLGSDVAGIVEAVGPAVTQFRPGDEVFGELSTGGFAEYACAPQEMFAAKPANVSFSAAAAVPLAGNTALQALRDVGAVQAGQSVLINGASGGVGSFAVQLASHYGATVTGVCSAANGELVRSLGAAEIIDYQSVDFTSSGRTYDLLLDLVGQRSIADLRRLLAPSGRLVLVGFSSTSHMLGSMWRGAWISWRGGQKVTVLNARANQADLLVLKGLLEMGIIRPVIDRQYPFAEIPAALRYLETGRARGKVVIGGPDAS